jgi:hypothetical protein
VRASARSAGLSRCAADATAAAHSRSHRWWPSRVERAGCDIRPEPPPTAGGRTLVTRLRARWFARGCDQIACGMATKTPVRPTLSDAQLGELMSLLRGSDTVELKLTIPASQQRAAIRALGLDALDAQIRQVVFFDTPDLALDRAGVVVRARRIQGRAGDSVIKLRRSTPNRSAGTFGVSAGSASKSTRYPADSCARGA